MPGSIAMPSGSAVDGHLAAVGVLLPVDRAGADELAGDGQCRVHEAAGIVAQVEHEPADALVELRLEAGPEVVGSVAAEAVDAQVADGPVGEQLVAARTRSG